MPPHHTASETIASLLQQRGSLLGYLRKRISSPALAEDLLQDCLLKAVRNASTLRNDEKLLPWFNRILDNAVIDLYRSRGSAPVHSDTDLDLLASFSEEEERILCSCIRDVIPSLKPEYAFVIERMELGPGDPAVIAGELGITRNTLKVRRHRARQALRRRLEETCRVCATHGCLDCTCRAH